MGFFGETKKSKSPAAATERHRNASKDSLVNKAKKFGIGRFWGQIAISLRSTHRASRRLGEFGL